MTYTYGSYVIKTLIYFVNVLFYKMSTCSLLILLILLIIVLFYLFSKVFIRGIKGGGDDDEIDFTVPEDDDYERKQPSLDELEIKRIDNVEQQLPQILAKLNNPSMPAQDFMFITSVIVNVIKEICSVRYSTINFPLIDRCIDLENKVTDPYKDPRIIDLIHKVIPSLYTMNKDAIVDFADNLITIYTRIKDTMNKSDKNRETINDLIEALKKIRRGDVIISATVPPSIKPPVTTSVIATPSTSSALSTSSVSSTPSVPVATSASSSTHVSNEDAIHAGHNIEPFTPNGVKINTSAIQTTPIALPRQTSDVVFPGTNTSVYNFDEFNLLEEYIRIWKLSDSKTFTSLKYKYSMTKKDVVAHSDEDEELDPFLTMDDEVTIGEEDNIIPVIEVLSPQSKLYNFSKTLINAAAANLKTNQGYIIQRIDHVDSLIIVGDLHGDLPALILCLRKYISILRSRSDTCLVFLGDYIDRGAASADIVFILALLKVMFPSRIYLCRGNHEDSAAYDFGGNFTGFTMLNSLEKRTGNGKEVFYAYLSFVIFICSLSCIIVDKSLLCTHGGFSQGCTYEMFVGKKLEFVPTVMTTGISHPIKCLMWEDYPFIQTVDRGMGCRNLGPVVFDKMLRDNGFNLFVKAHVHNAAGSHIHEESVADLYIIITSLLMTSRSVNGMIRFAADYGNNKMTSTTVPYGSIEKLMIARRATASMLYVVFNPRTNTFDQELISILEGADNNQYLDHLHADIIAYFNESFPVTNSIIKAPTGTPIDQELMTQYKTNIFAQSLKTTHDKFKTLSDVTDVLSKAEGRS